MRMTPLEIREQQIKKKLFGYDVNEVEALRELVCEALEEARKEITGLEEELNAAKEKLAEHEERESILKETITTAQKMVEDIKENAKKEAELIISEASRQAEEMRRQALERAEKIQDEIFQLKKQRIELVNSIKSILDYHRSILSMEEEDSKRMDDEADKLKFFPNK